MILISRFLLVGTLTEFAIAEDALIRFLKDSSNAGFDIIEIAENNIELDKDKKEKNN